MKYSFRSVFLVAGLVVAIGLAGFFNYRQENKSGTFVGAGHLDTPAEGASSAAVYGGGGVNFVGPRNHTSTVSSLLQAFSSALNSEDKVRFARELNQAYFATSSREERKNISSTLSRHLKNENGLEVARALALSHSRLYFDENTLSNLKFAYERKILSFDDYFGELAHVFPGAPVDIREEIVAEIANSHNRYAIDIVSNTLSGEDKIALSNRERDDLQRFLKTNEPIFNGAADSFGYFDAIRYENWLVASSRLSSDSNVADAPEKFLAEKLLNPATDPRALVAFAVSSYATTLTHEQRAAIQWESIRARAQDFVQRNPNSTGLQYIGQQLFGTGKQ